MSEDPVRSGKDDRPFVLSVLWILNRQPLTGSAVLVRPLERIFARFRDWAKTDIWKRLFDPISDDPDMEYVLVDATIFKVHRESQGAKGGLKVKRLAARKAA